MAKIYDGLNEELVSFIEKQKIFFVATAPLSADGMINLSPKGYETFKVFNKNTVGYIDYPGSGNETARHVKENCRLTIMFCGFEEKPLVLRIYGKGKVIERKSEEFNEMGKEFGKRFGPWLRQIIILHVEKVKTSCGESIPFFVYKGERENIHQWASAKEERKELESYISSHS